MIEFAGKKWAEPGDDPAGCYGTARRYVRSIKFYMDGEQIGGINGHGVPHSTTEIDGKPWHTHLYEKHPLYIESLLESHEQVDALTYYREYNRKKDAYDYHFKPRD